MAAIRWTRQFHAMLATPLRVATSCLGHLLYIACRLSMVGAIYLWRSSPRSARCTRRLPSLALPVVVLIGLALLRAGLGVLRMARARRRLQRALPFRRHADVPLLRDVLPGHAPARTVLREVAYATPLWNGVDLMRHLTLGTRDALARRSHTSRICSCGLAAGQVLARRTFQKRLVA